MPPSGKRPRAAPLSPAEGMRLMNKALDLHRAGKLPKAEKIYRQVLAASPRQPDTTNMLGVLLMQKGDVAGAVETLRRAVDLEPNPDALSNLGMALAAAEDFAAAVSSYRGALAVAPNHPAALYGLGRTLRLAGRPAEALDPLERLLANDPGAGSGLYERGMAFKALGRAAEALADLRRASAAMPDRPWPHMELARLTLEAGDVAAAVTLAKTAVRIVPDDPSMIDAFADLIRYVIFPGPDPEALAMIETAFHTEGADTHLLDKPVISLLSHDPAVAALLDKADGEDGAAAVARAVAAGETRVLTELPVFVTVVARTLPTNPRFETLLTHLRHALAVAVAGGEDLDKPTLAFAAALARQSHNNEFIYAVGDAEAALAATLRQALEESLSGTPKPDARLAALVAGCGFYTPLHTVDGAEALAKLGRRFPDPVLTSLIADYVAAPLRERDLIATIRAITPIEDDVSLKVQAQYEESPYPRWFEPPTTMVEPLGVYLPHAFPHLDPPDFLAAPQRVLIAGCGSGHHAFVVARQVPTARILAIDLSRASLAHALRWQEQLGADSIDFVHGDILKLGALDETFQIVESYGVLHHMKDPLAGWRVLTGLTEPGGLMHIALYSELARKIVVESRAYIAENGYADTPDDIRRFRHAIRALPEGAFLRDGNVRNREFYSVSSLRDLLFHVQEHRYTVPLIAEQAEELGLDFVGFASLDPGVEAAYRARFPGDETLTDLDNWAAFETDNPRTFRNTYDMWFSKRA